MLRRLGVLPVILLCSCAYVVVEEDYLPSISNAPKNSSTIVNPTEIDNTIEFEQFALMLNLSFSTTQYRGLKVLGSEVRKDPDRNVYEGQNVALSIGVSTHELLSFSPWSLKLELLQKNGNVDIALPSKVFRVKSSPFCGFDHSENGWGTRSEYIATGNIVAIKAENTFDCFNVIYDIPESNFSDIKLGISNSLLPTQAKFVYFYKQKIKWVRSN